MNTKKSLKRKENSDVLLWKTYYIRNNYYHKKVAEMTAYLIPSDVNLIEFGCKCGELLSGLPNKEKTGIDETSFIQLAPKRRGITFQTEASVYTQKKKYDYVLLAHKLSHTIDIQNFIVKLKKISHSDTKVVVYYFNFLWKPILDIAEKLGLKLPEKYESNWLSPSDIYNIFNLSDYELVKSEKKILIPLYIPFISDFINKYIAPLPLINSLCLMNFAVFKQKAISKEYSVSIVIPARNEAGNMNKVLSKIPKFGRKLEVVFVEGNSKDDTYEAIEKEIKRYKGPITAHLYKQIGKGKGDAVRLGFSKSKNEVLMILDADLTVDPRELPKFYDAIASGKGDFIMGSRLVYPMEQQAMRSLNILGNKFFSLAFSFLLDQKIRDTLCGTKVLFKKDYEKIVQNRKIFGDFDPFGDFDLIFGMAKLNLKIIEIPVRYKERTYGSTNISRFTHGFLLLRMVVFAARKLKFV